MSRSRVRNTLVPSMPLTQPRLRAYRLDAHQPHQPLPPLPVHRPSLAPESDLQTARPVERRRRVHLVERAHDRELGRSRPVAAGSRTTNGESPTTRIDVRCSDPDASGRPPPGDQRSTNSCFSSANPVRPSTARSLRTAPPGPPPGPHRTVFRRIANVSGNAAQSPASSTVRSAPGERRTPTPVRSTSDRPAAPQRPPSPRTPHCVAVQCRYRRTSSPVGSRPYLADCPDFGVHYRVHTESMSLSATHGRTRITTARCTTGSSTTSGATAKPHLVFLDYSVPKDDPIHNAPSERALREAIYRKIARSHVVVIPTGMYVNYSKWIKKEIGGATEKNKPI